MSLIRIVYVSEASIALDAVEAEIGAILARSRAWNRSVSITGALMFNRGFFAQVLEGPRTAVEQLFAAIVRDPRHRRVIKLDYSVLADRGFAGWSMAFVGTDGDDRARFGHLGSDTGFDHAVLVRERLFGTLHTLLIEREHRVAASTAQAA